MFEATRTPRSFVQGRLDGVVRRIVACTLAGCTALAGESREARAQSIGDLAAWLDAHLPHAELISAIVGALFVVGLGLLLARRKARPRSQG